MVDNEFQPSSLTVASGDTRPYVGTSDLCMMY